MNDEPFRTHAPFGVATKKFAKIGFHPELDKSGAMKREITKVGPGSYNPRPHQCKFKKGMSWKHKLELEEFSKYLGFRNAHVLKEREFFKTLGGPGGNDVNEDLMKKQSSSQKENVGFGSGPRIAKCIEGQIAPPPNTYMRRVSEEFKPSKKTFSQLPTFEWDGLSDRFKSQDKSYHLPCNLYNLNDRKNVADITKKIISSRGPYDCFTGPRDGTTIKNYFSPPKKCSPDYFYVKPGDIDILNGAPSKKRYGLFLTGPRFQKKPTARHMLNDLSLCYRNPKDPGPTHYHMTSSSIQEHPPSKYPFDSSNIHARPPINWRISPGPGRYNPRAPRCMKLKRPTWVFLSKGDRSLFKVTSYSLFT